MASSHDSHKSPLLDLPAEIRAQILQHAVKDKDVAFFVKQTNSFQFRDYFKCEPCLVQHPHRDDFRRLHDLGNWCNKSPRDVDHSALYQDTFSTNNMNPSFNPDTGSPAYSTAVSDLLVCKSLFTEALPILRRTATIHIANPEAIPAAKQLAPTALCNNVQNMMLYVHLTTDTQIPWMRALDQLHSVFPQVKKIKIHYHMRPPISYEFLMDALYLTIPILSWPRPFRQPLFVRAEETQAAHDGRTQFAKSEGTAILAAETSRVSDQREEDGMSIHCCYKTAEVLFEARFLGNIGTCDSIEEHTAVIRALFCDGPYVAVARNFVSMCHSRGSGGGSGSGVGGGGRKWVSAGVPGVHLPTIQTALDTAPESSSSTSSSTAAHTDNVPREPGQLQGPAASAYTGLVGAEEGGDPVVNRIQRCLLEVARRYERPWFEKLQRRRIVELYMQQGGMSQADAETLVDRQTVEMGEAGVAGVIEGILASDPDLDE